MQIPGWAELRSHGRGPPAVGLLRVPDPVPPLLVAVEIGGILRRARIRHLRALFITYARVDMDTSLGSTAQRRLLIVQLSLADTHPVAEVGAYFQVFEPIQHAERAPGCEQD